MRIFSRANFVLRSMKTNIVVCNITNLNSSPYIFKPSGDGILAGRNANGTLQHQQVWIN